MSEDPQRIVVAGDWHGNTRWAYWTLLQARRLLAGEDRKIVLHLGDFGFYPCDRYGLNYLTSVSQLLRELGMELWFVDGNHEDHAALGDMTETLGKPGLIPVRGYGGDPAIYWLSRGYRWSWHGRRWLALGGATSLNRAELTEGLDWFPGEAISAEQALAVIAAGPADVMVTHDCPASVVHAYPDFGFPAVARRVAETHSARLQAVVDVVEPDSLLHGHLHTGYVRPVEQHYGTLQVSGLACDGMNRNWGVLNIKTMAWEHVEDPGNGVVTEPWAGVG